MTGEQHIPARPSWRCEVSACAVPWPCPPAQAAILAAITSGLTDRVGQTVYLSGQMMEALGELDADELPEPHGRFLGWLPPGRIPRQVAAGRRKPHRQSVGTPPGGGRQDVHRPVRRARQGNEGTI